MKRLLVGLLAVGAVFGAAPAAAIAAAPETTITSAVDGDSGANLVDEDGNGSETLNVNFTVDPGVRAYVKLDSGSYVQDDEPSARLYPKTGTHTISVRGRDAVTGEYDLTPSTVTFKICASGETAGCGVTSITNPVSQPPTPDTAAPSAPSNLTATAGNTAAVLSWGASTDNVAVTGYQVFRDNVQVATVTGTSYTSSGLTNGQSYAFNVRAFDAAGNVSGPSNTVNVTPVAPPAPPAGGCQAGWFPVDGQSWWWQPSFGGDPEFNSRHLHVGGCIPRRDQVFTGTIPFDITVKMHNNPGTVYYVAIVVKTDSMEKSISVNPGWRCAGADCTFTRRFEINASEFDRSGLEEIRFRASDRQSDLGTELRASINFQTRIENGKARDDVGRFPFLRGKGWYTNALYCEADYRDDLTPVPSGPLSGTWTPQVRQVDHNAGDAPVTGNAVRLDPNIHGGDHGVTLRQGTGSFQGPVPVNTAGLTAGPHKLFIKSDCATSTGLNTGVLVVPFDVG